MTKDNIATLAALGLLDYASADVAHHVFGHGGGCLLLGGQVVSVTSVFVNCTVRGTAIDLAGPLANLVTGAAALLVLRFVRRADTARPFLILVAAFNLMWFSLQLVNSAARRIDDWAWFLQEYHVGPMGRFAMIAAGVAGFVLAVRATAFYLAAYAGSRARIRRIVLTAWLSAGELAFVTALFDHNAAATIMKALPQSLVLSIGLLLVPRVSRGFARSGANAAAIEFSAVWVIAAAVVVLASILLLGPGFAVSL